MLSTLLFPYILIVAASALVGLLLPRQSAALLRLVAGLARLGAGVGALCLVLLLIQQLGVIAISALPLPQTQLPSPPLSMLLNWVKEGVVVSGVFLSWWDEELRLISALVLLLPLGHLGMCERLLAVGHSDAKNAKCRTGAVRGLVGASLLALPFGLVLMAGGWQASVKAIISPRRGVEAWPLPPREDWLWEGSASFIGFGHIWAFKVLVLLTGLFVVWIAVVQIVSAARMLRLPADAEGQRCAGG